jgi:hypothetical protein
VSKLPNKDEFAALLDRQLQQCEPSVRDAAVALLIDPLQKTLLWEYGALEPHSAWVFADLGERNVFAAYCLGGHGALGSPWGMVFMHDQHFGQDSGWFRSLQELLADWGVGGEA